VNSPLIAHVIYRLGVGGMEHGLIKLINGMPVDAYDHVIICLNETTDLQSAIRRPDVPVISLHKREGQDLGAYWRLWKLLRRLRPQILHTRTLGVLDAQVYGALAGVPARVHGEHGRQADDLDWKNVRHRRVRRCVRPFVHHYIAVSRDLETHLVDAIGVPPRRVTQIYNGVDTVRFSPRAGARRCFGPEGFITSDSLVIGTVGRLQPVKDQLTLTKAFLYLLRTYPEARKRLRLVLIGDGPLRETCQRLLNETGATDFAWLPGELSNVDALLPQMDIFILPSLGEGICNTILEAMACALPVIATRVGGNPELVEDGCTGVMVPPADPPAMAASVVAYLENSARIAEHGGAGRQKVEREFTLERMISKYMQVYDAVLQRTGQQGSAHSARTVASQNAKA
jgi:sugar transferase (PEP-CTERM/EpsH1 system associated)